MKTLHITATANDVVIEQLKTIIENFAGQQDKAESIAIKTELAQPMVYDDIRQLKGILNTHYPKPLSDSDIENGIAQGAAQRAMML
ncbi:hypothetical protein B0181_10865 [Moraxella caviae]|uniref:Uncharacterized protein n=1 Tax=Moraxella caviae TaxID=34060 RepID=A0A1S9ZUZ6_9GAMM|nr:hypothetical protein [Moraxella caviae]OOR87213.1 hypothetical protein B0181_10865 [Moraxella caviae]STZ09924.1 Uncharacterised protein [Moraxella caviae]